MRQTVIVNLRRLRRDRGLSQADLATQTHVSRQTINSIETGKYTPATELALRLADVLDCRVEDLFSLAEASSTLASVSDGPLEVGDRVLTGRVGERVVAHRLSGPQVAPDAFVAADAHAVADGLSLLVPEHQLDRTVLLAGCDPSLSLLGAFVARKAPEHRIVALHSVSEAALRQLADGLVHVAGSHLQGEGGGEDNVADARKVLNRNGGLVVSYATWEQGIVVAPGNPRRIRTLGDLSQPRVRIVNRDTGSGSRRVLDRGLAKAGMNSGDIPGYDTEVPTHMAVARSVQAGTADAGIALRAVAHAFGLDFVPLAELRFDFIIPAEHLQHPTVRIMLDVLQSRALRADLAALPGYDVSRTGTKLLELEAA